MSASFDMGVKSFDAIVVGGGLSGLTAAAYLARGGQRVCLLEARDGFGGQTETIDIGDGFRASFADDTVFALDPQVIGELRLHDHGLRFAERDMPLVALRQGGRHIVIPRDNFGLPALLGGHAAPEIESWRAFRRAMFRLARRLRPL